MPKVRILLPIPSAMSVALLMYILFAGAILCSQATSDDPRKLYSQENPKLVQQKRPYEKLNLQSYLPFLGKFFQEPPHLPEARYQDVEKEKIKPPAVSEPNRSADLKSGGSGLSRKEWYIIGGTVIILVFIFAAIISFCCYKNSKKKKRAKKLRAIDKLITESHPSNPPFQFNVDNIQQSTSPLETRTVIAEVNATNSSNLVTKQHHHETQSNEKNVFPITLAESNTAMENAEIENVINDSRKIEADGRNVEAVAQTLTVELNKSTAKEITNVSSEHHQVLKEPQRSNSELHRKKANQIVKDHDNIISAKYPRRKYDSESATSDIDPRRRADHYIREEYERGYDSDQSRYGHDFIPHDRYSDPRIHDHYSIPRLQEHADHRFAYTNEDTRIGPQARPESTSYDYSLQRRLESPRIIKAYSGRDAYHMHRVNDHQIHNPKKYEPRYDGGHSHASQAWIDFPEGINQHSRHNDHVDYKPSTIMDSRYKDPFSRDVRHELGAVIANASFTKNDYSKKFIDPPVRKDSFTIYTSPRASQKEHNEYHESYLSTKMNVNTSPETILVPKPDYQLKDNEESLVSQPLKKPSIVAPKPVVQPVIKPREFKGPYGPEDLDEMYNPYTWARGKAQRPALDNVE